MDRQKNNDNNCNSYIRRNCNNNIIDNNKKNGGQNRKKGVLEWTNERHSKFLSSMEASFVQNMLEKSSNSTTTFTKLDRFIPDISESTLDLRSSASAHPSNRLNTTCNQQPMLRPCNMVHDQVVLQLEEKRGGRIEIDLNK